jgi:gliding motility-associated-like protein
MYIWLMRPNPLLIFFAFFCFSSFYAGDDPVVRAVTPHVSPALKFTENAGQWKGNILFRAQLDGGALYIEKDGLTFSFYDKKKYRALHHAKVLNGNYKDLKIKAHAYKVYFENCNPDALTEKLQAGSDYENYFIGKDQKTWRGNVKNYHQVWLRNLYNGIDYEAITSATGIKYNFHIQANTSPDAIKMRYDGVDGIKLKDGALVIKLSISDVVEQKPYAYQLINGTVVPVKCEYRLKDKTLGFSFPKGYNKNYELVIDPILVFAAQSGSTADNFGMTATFDPQGNLYAGGTVFDFGYPVTFGAYDTGFNGPGYNGTTDVVITKYNTTGSSLLYATYFGGTQSEIVTSLIVDSNNNLCLYGATGSADFPVTATAYDTTFNGGNYLSFYFNGTTFTNGTDIYVAKFNTSGTTLLGSTYFGGSDNDGVNHVNHLSLLGYINNQPVYEYVTDSLQNNYGDQYRGEIQLDAGNNIYIASCTRSSDFPAVNGFDNTLGGKQDGVLAKFNSNLSSLVYSSFIGGNSNDAGYGLLVKDNLEVYVTGGTCSGVGFPGAGGYQANYQGGSADGYVIRVNAAGNAVTARTFFGTSQFDQSYFIQSDKYNNIYVYGQSLGNIPVVIAANQTTVFNVPNTHQFISRFNAGLSSLNLSTVFGHYTSVTDISPCAFSVDKCNDIYISGWGSDLFGVNPPMTNMPLLQPTQSTTDGHDFYFMGLDSNAAILKYGSYFGGGTSEEHVDGGTSRFDPRGRIYQSACAGCGGNDDFPVTPGAWPNTPGNPNHAQNCNNGVVKLDFQLQVSVATINTNTLTGCVPMSLTLTNATPATGSTSTYMWYLGNGSTTSTTPNPAVTYTAPGTYTVALVVKDNLTCNKIDSTISFVTVYPKPSGTILLTSNPCSNTIQISNSASGNLGANPFTWLFDDNSTSTLTSLSHTFATNGVHTISLTVTDLNGCSVTKTNTLSIFNFTTGVVNSASICSGSGTVITASGGTGYTWTPSGSLNNPSIAAPVASPSVTTIYTIQVINTSPGYGCAGTLTTQVIVKPSPTASFGISGDHCSNVITTANASTGTLNANAFDWNFGDGSPDATDPSPSYTYPGNGTYTVSLTVTDVNGCTSVKTNTVAIFNFTPGVVNSGSICSGFTTNITALGGTNYTWTPAITLDNASVGSPIASPSVTTTYTVNILNTTPGYDCARTLTTEVLVRPSPVAGFSYSANPCGGGVYFTDQSVADVTDWQWVLSPTNTSTVQNPYNFYHTGGTFTISLVSTNSYGCQNLISKVISIATPPEVSVSSSVNICIGDSVQLNASGGTAYQWMPVGSLDFPTMANPIATPTISTEYSVNITSATTSTADGKPCQLLLTTQVNVFVLSTIPISAQANPVIITTGSATTLTYLGSPGATVTWLPANATSPGSGYTVTAYPVKPTTYTVTAVNGPCEQSVQVHVDAYTEGCLDKDVFIPNTFTPNSDGQNDVLFVRGLKVTETYFAIYNRWGELVFETSDKAKGWDGSYKGKPADVGVFGWYLRATCINGEETFKKGNVTLIR